MYDSKEFSLLDNWIFVELWREQMLRMAWAFVELAMLFVEKTAVYASSPWKSKATATTIPATFSLRR